MIASINPHENLIYSISDHLSQNEDPIVIEDFDKLYNFPYYLVHNNINSVASRYE